MRLLPWLALALSVACSTPTPPTGASGLLRNVVGTKPVLRGLHPGMKASQVLAAEGSDPAVLDSVGVVFRYALPANGRLEVACYWEPPKPDSLLPADPRVASVVLSVELGNEATAKSFLMEMGEWARTQTGQAPQGSLGEQRWPLPENNWVLMARFENQQRDAVVQLVRAQESTLLP